MFIHNSHPGGDDQTRIRFFRADEPHFRLQQPPGDAEKIAPEIVLNDVGSSARLRKLFKNGLYCHLDVPGKLGSMVSKWVITYLWGILGL